MRVTVLPKIGSTFLPAGEAVQGTHETDLWMYELPKEFIDRIRKAKGEYWNTAHAYIVIKADGSSKDASPESSPPQLGTFPSKK